MTDAPARRLKTYSLLPTGRRIPSEYELVSSRLHYHYPHNFELSNENPVSQWYFEHRESSLFQAADWEEFADPRRTTYRAYNELQDAKETVVDGLLREIDVTGYDDALDSEWLAFLHHWYGPLRFPVHGLEMLSAYVAQMAPASRITNCGAFQAADEMRRLQRIAYRSVQLHTHRGSGDPSEHRAFWEDAKPFQPLRELIEKALIAYDWGESFTALNLVIKPHVDRVINEELAGALAAANGDTILREVHFSLNEDARWHRDWSMALTASAIADTPANADQLRTWAEKWRPLAVNAVEALVSVVADAPVPLDSGTVHKAVIAGAEDDLARALAVAVT
jgi:toluene monooxygenase system protein E